MNCSNCPVPGGCTCPGERTKHLCALVDPKSPSYNPSYRKVILDRSGCKEPTPQRERMRPLVVGVEPPPPVPATESPTSFPSLPQQAWNFTKAVTRHVVNHLRNVSETVRSERMAICQACPELRDGKCQLCSCPLEKKIRWASEFCPIGKWGQSAPDKKCRCGRQRVTRGEL
jgi:hypothetical protein